MDLPATQLLNDDDDDTLSSQSLNSSQVTPKKVHQVANLCIGSKKYPIFKGINKIGRSPGCDVCINDLSVSKNHAELEIKTNCFYICDLRSSNKTRINNEPLRPDRFYQIVDGSKLTFGIINAQFLLLRDNNDSIIVPETPAPGLKLRYDGNKSSITDSDDSVILGTQEAKDEAIFAKPTLPIRSPSTREARRKLNTSIHDIETQRCNQSDENNDPSIFDCETQKINNSNKKNSIYDIETQQLDDNGIKSEVFDLATQRLPDEPNVESDIYSMGTQKINTADNPGIYDLDTQKVDVKDDTSSVYDVDTQRIAADDDIYNCETQRINKQFEITISKCKKTRNSNKNSNVLKEVAVVLKRNGTKNGGEDNRKQQHVSTVVDDSETDDELVNDIKSKQNSSVHQSSSGITIVAKKSNNSNKVSSTSVKAQNHFIAETDDESETDDEEAVVNLKSRVHDEVNDRSELNDKEPLKNNEIGSNSETDDEELAQSQDKKQSKKNNDNKNDSGSETDDEIPLSNKPESLSVTSVDKNKILNKGVDSEAGNNACPSPVLVDFSKIQQPGTGLNSDDDDDDETDDDEVYMTPNQIVSPHKKIPSKSEEPGLDTAPLVKNQTMVAVSPRNSELDCDPDAPTQIISSINNACEETNKLLNNSNNSHEVPDDFAPTQLINPQNNCKDDDETDDEEVELSRNKLVDRKNEISVSKDQIKEVDELASTQIVDSTNKISTTCDQDFCDAPTQLLNLETQAVHSGIEDTQKLLGTQRDDLEPTQLIDSQPTFSSMREKAETNNQLRNKDKINNDDDIDSDDLDNAPTQIINFENDNLDNNPSSVIKNHRFSRRASSTPVSEVKKKVSLSSMKNVRVNLDKLPNVQPNNLNINEEKKVDSNKINDDKKTKLKDNNDDDDKLNSDSHNDSIVRNLDAMFGGSNDDELEDAIPLQTQQLEEILSDVPEKLHNVNNFQKSGSQDNKTNLRNRKIGESRVDSRASTPDTQEIYFAKLSSKKKKSNVLVDSQGSSTSQTVVRSESKAAKEIVYAPGTVGFSNGVPIESDESVGVYESPDKKLKPKVKVTEKGAKCESETKQTVDPVNEDDFFAGLPDVRIAGTEAYPASSTVSSSDSEDDYSTDNMVKKLQKSMAEIKAMEENDEDYGIFSKSKQIPKQSNSSLPKIKHIDDDDSSSDGEIDFARLKQLADRLLNANDKEKILTGLKEVSSNNNNNKKQVKTETTSKVTDKKSTRKRVLPQKLNDGTFTLDNTLNDVTSLDVVPAKRSRRARKNSESSTSTISVNLRVGEKKAPVETKKKAVTTRSKKIDVDQSLPSTSVSSGTEDKKIEVETKKKATSKRFKPTNNEMNLASTSSSSIEEQKIQPETKKRTAAKRTKKVDADQTDFDASTSSTTPSSTLNSSILSKRSRVSVVDSPSTPTRSRHSIRPVEKMQYKIIFTGINYENHEQAIQRLGGIISNDPMTGTILVTDKVRRTLKFICAISRSIPIVSENWIKASIQSNKFVGTDEYILTDLAAEAKFDFNLQHSLIKSKERSLLHNQTFVITAGINQPSVNELKNMIQVAGGKALVRAPKTWSNTFIISCEADIPKVKKLIANIPKNIKVPVVTTEFLLAGILKQELEVEKYTLSF